MRVQSASILSFADMKGEFRLRLFNEARFQELCAKHPDWPREYILRLVAEDDTGWVENTITDYGRQRINVGDTVAFAGNLDLFIHESAAPGDVERSCLNFTYANQVPSQIANPVNNFDPSALVQTRTQTFGAPAVDRNINVVGLTALTTVTTAERYVHGIMAYSMLSSTRVQTTVQTADVQYRVTWSFQ